MKMNTDISWKFVLWTTIGVLLFTATPLAGQRRSLACVHDMASPDCLLDIEPCMRRILGNVTKIPIDIGKESATNLIEHPIQGILNAAKSTGAVTQLFVSLFVPLKDMAEGALSGATKGRPDQIVTSSMVGFFKILLTITTDTHIRNDTATIHTMDVVFPRLRKIDLSLACAVRTMGGPQAWILLPLTAFSDVILIYMIHCFAVTDATLWCQFFNQIVPLSLKIVIEFIPLASKTVVNLTEFTIKAI